MTKRKSRSSGQQCTTVQWIERHPVDRIATADDLKAASLEVRETAEQAAVAKTAHVVE